MHSSHYPSFTIHHHGDYSGDYIIVDICRDEKGNSLNIDNYTEIEISSKTFDEKAKKILKEQPTFEGIDNILLEGNDETTVVVNTKDVLSFYLEKLRKEEISKLDSLKFEQLIKRYANT